MGRHYNRKPKRAQMNLPWYKKRDAQGQRPRVALLFDPDVHIVKRLVMGGIIGIMVLILVGIPLIFFLSGSPIIATGWILFWGYVIVRKALRI